MADTTLQRELEAERGAAIRSLLARPFLHAQHDRETFRVILRHGDWLVEWFQTTCGWHLEVDGPGSFARLHKRRHQGDRSRPLRRLRGVNAPFDRRRYELLCRICAELISPPRTTLGLLAQQLVAATTDAPTPVFDTSVKRERAAFVDALAILADLGVITISQGAVDTFIDDREGNALIETDVARMHQLLASTVPPSRLAAGTAAEATVALLADPRAVTDDDDIILSDEHRNRANRQLIARRLFDDPVVHRDELTEDQLSYLGSLSGRQWIRARVAEAGLELESRAEGLLVVDETATATDLRFPAPEGNVWQVALLLVERFVVDSGDERRLVSRSPVDLEATVAELLRTHRSWGKQFRVPGGTERLTALAVELLASLGLVRIQRDLVVPRPAIARYRPGSVVTTGSTLFDPGDS